MEEEDPVAHMVQRSHLKASKDIWSLSKEYVQLMAMHNDKETKSDHVAVQFQELIHPLCRKLLICEIQEAEQKIVLQHAMSSSGFLTVPQLRGEGVAQIDIDDKALPLNAILNAEILGSFAQTSVTMITCGFEHCTVLTRAGTVATWGYGASGCLGHGNYISYTSPKLVRGLRQNVVFVESGAYHTVAVGVDGGLSVWGRSDVGQLGVGQTALVRDTKVRSSSILSHFL